MPTSEQTNRRPRAVKSLPEAIERAFRTAACETVLLRIATGKFAQEMSARAIFHYERILRASSIVGSAEEGSAGLIAAVERFAAARLRRRLVNLPVERIHLADHHELDFLAIDGNGKCYAIRCVASPARNEELVLARRLRATLPGLSGFIVYSIDDGGLRKYAVDELMPAPRRVRQLSVVKTA